MKSFSIVQVDYKYCNYLRNFDNKVPYNSNDKRNRPFIGVLFKVGELEYFTPLSSPKEKHKKMKNNIDFSKIDRGNLGAINFNNMIPVKKACYEEFNLYAKPKNVKEEQYYHLLYLQLLWLNRNYDNITKKAITLYNNYLTKKLPKSVYNRCCNFVLLEEMCKKYQKSLVSN